MEVAVSAARWVVTKALAPVTDDLLEAWAASAGLGPNIDALKMQLLYAQGMLNNAPGQGRDITNPALKGLLHKLRQLAYVADDALDELDYFRIQDALDGTYHAAADMEDQGCLQGLVLNARHTARAAAKQIKSMSSCSRAASPPDDQEDIGGTRGCCCVGRGCSMPKVASGAVQAAVGKHFPCCYSSPHTSELVESPSMPAASRWRLLCGACPPKAPAQRVRTTKETSKLKFDRVEMSKRMIEIVEQLKHVCAMVSTILNLELLSLSRIPTQVGLAMDRPKTTPQIIEPQLYGRDTQKKEIIDGITHGEYSSKQLTVLPIVGPGGVGKTTFTQHIFEEVKSCFQVTIWICVSLNFTADRLAQEILDQIPKDNSESKNSSKEEQIEQRLRSKRFLLVLDDVWKYHDDEWKKLLAPFKKVGTEGNMVIVTTRIPGVANMVRTVDHSIEMERLDPQGMMSFFEACVFGDQQQPWKQHSELQDVGHKIVEKLKGFPLAAKTVGRLLRNQLTFDHWTRVLESKEWESEANDNDIMPALKLSYDYLPFHLQQCLSCCALFPEDYEFHAEELVHLWIGLGILHSDGQKKRIEDVGSCYFTELVNQGFFKENVSRFGSLYYTIHDLLRELLVKVSSYECLSISSSNVMSIQIPPSVRHLSIIVDDADVKDKVTFEDYKRSLQALEKRFEVQSLHTLMLFGEYHANFLRVFRGLFLEARALRTVFFSGASYNVEDVLPNFSKLVHLRYLRIKSAGSYDEGLCISSALCRLYHLEVIDLQGWKGRFGSTRYMNNLVKLRHFVVPRKELHSDIFEVGRLKFINELRAFRVGQEENMFELSQLGKLENIGGLLGIYNLEKVQSEEEAAESKLMHKSHIQELILEWDVQQSNRNPKFEEIVLENLVPHSYLPYLSIRGHGGTNCPRWLGANLAVKNLESLSLHDLSWGNLPALGEMWMVNDLGVEYQDCILRQRFHNLKRLELVNIPRLRKWVADNTSDLFPQLELLTIKDCSELTELRYSHHRSGLPPQENSMAWFPKLNSLSIEDCPKLVSFPPIPWTSGPCSVRIEWVGSGLERLVLYKKETGSGSTLSLEVKEKDGEDCVFLNGLVFSNLTYLKNMVIENCSPLLLDHLIMLTSLEFLQICGSSNVLSPVESVSHVRCLLPVKKISVKRCGCNGKELTELFSLMPKLTKMTIECCQEIKWLGVAGQSSASSSSAASEQLHHGQIGQQQQEAKGGVVDGVLLLPPQLQGLEIIDFPELSLLSYSLEDDKEGGGLQGLRSLQSLDIRGCPKLLHSYSSSSIPFPTSLQELKLTDCGEFRGEGIGPLLAQGHLPDLYIFKTPKFFACSEPLDKELLPCSSAHQELEVWTDDIAGFLTAHSCSLLSSSLTTLNIDWKEDAERFTHEQEEALALLTSLQVLYFFGCKKLQCLPAGLHRLASLETLGILDCQVIRSLPEDGLPSSLKTLEIHDCPAIKSLPNGSLPSSLKTLDINSCPAIKSLPNGSLPSSLQVLNIFYCPALMSLPKNGLPSSLQELNIGNCPALVSLPKNVLPSSLQKLEIWGCPALKWLPEDGLPRSLQELIIGGSTAINSLPKGALPRSLQVLDVRHCDNEELKRQCRKLRGTIPKIITA